MWIVSQLVASHLKTFGNGILGFWGKFGHGIFIGSKLNYVFCFLPNHVHFSFPLLSHVPDPGPPSLRPTPLFVPAHLLRSLPVHFAAPPIIFETHWFTSPKANLFKPVFIVLLWASLWCSCLGPVSEGTYASSTISAYALLMQVLLKAVVWEISFSILFRFWRVYIVRHCKGWVMVALET